MFPVKLSDWRDDSDHQNASKSVGQFKVFIGHCYSKLEIVKRRLEIVRRR